MSILFGKIWGALFVSTLVGFLIGWGIRACFARTSVRRLENLYKDSIDSANRKNAVLVEDIDNLKKFYTDQFKIFKSQHGLSPAGISIKDEYEPEIIDTEPEKPDDLTKILGINKKTQKRLNNLGIYTYQQIANLNQHNINWVANRIGSTPERIYQERWVQQAHDMRSYQLH